MPEPSPPWVAYPDMYTAQGEDKDGADWLQIDDVAPPTDSRPKLLNQPMPPTT